MYDILYYAIWNSISIKKVYSLIISKIIENNADTNWINILENKKFGWTEKTN